MLEDSAWPLILLLPFGMYFVGCSAAYMVRTWLGRELPFDPEMAARGRSVLLGRSVRQVGAWSLRPLVGWLAAARIGPNGLTIAALLVSLVAGVLIGLGAVTLGGVFGLVAASLDYFDGRIARLSARVSRAGSFLDSTLDRYGEVALLGGAVVLFRDSIGMLIACLVALGSSGVVSYARAKAETLGVQLRSGLMQRPERLLLFCLGACAGSALEPLLPEAAQGRHAIFAAAIALLAVLTTHTALHRTSLGFRALRDRAEVRSDER
jgi:CDP-diacylglycerol---glycerol-3-phosphate 3-phosphatidyltransferase